MTTSEGMPPDGVKRVIYTSEAWYSQSVNLLRAPDVTDQWSLGVDNEIGGGTYGEWSITWRDLGRRPTWRLDVYGDGLACAMASGLLDLLVREQGASPTRLREALAADGWVDRTERRCP